MQLLVQELRNSSLGFRYMALVYSLKHPLDKDCLVHSVEASLQLFGQAVAL